MAEDLIFYGWNRAAGALAGIAQAGRLRATLNLEVRGDHPGETAAAPLTFEFHGAPDIQGLLPGAITHVSPEPGSTSAEETMCPYVELGAPDLPWRYSPEPRNGDRWRPWIALVVGPADQTALQGRGEVAIGMKVLEQHPLPDSAKWAHVQTTNPPPPALPHTVSRLLSPYPLEPNTDYLAVVVPAFDSAGNPSWTGAQNIVVRAYHSWRFRTGDAGNFKDLALRLKTRPIDDPLVASLGRDAVEFPLPDRANVVVVRSALVPPSAVPSSGIDPDGPPPSDVVVSVAEMRLPKTDEQGRRVVQLPRYGEAWVSNPLLPAAGWGAALNDNPRHRVAAGLGLWCGVAKQDLIAEAASARAGGLFVAAQRIRGLAAGLAAAGSLWRRRLPGTPESRLRLFGPALARVASVDGQGNGGTVLKAVTDGDNGRNNGRPMPPALFSSAAQRMFRPRTARARLAAPGAVTAEGIIPAANDCDRLAPILRPSLAPDGGRSQRGLPHADLLASALRAGDGTALLQPINEDALGRRLTDAGAERALLDRISQHLWPELLRALLRSPRDEAAIAALIESSREERERLEVGHLRETLGAVGGRGPVRPRCRPVDLKALDAVLVSAFRPDQNGIAARRVLDSIDGLDPNEPLAPPEICPDLDLPAWRFLRDEGRDWLLLGRQGIQPDDVVALGTNPRFINAFLTGLNTQALGELRWRNIPVKSRCTPLRRFWDRITSATAGAPSQPATDIRGIALWDQAQPLGHVDHSPDPNNVRQLVIVFRTDLFRRYPRTLVYLTSAAKTPGGTTDWMANATFAPNVAPVFTGEIDPDLVFFGFPLKPEELADRWVVVEEAPPGYRFEQTKLPSGLVDGGVAAQASFAVPTRVLFRGDQFLGSAS